MDTAVDLSESPEFQKWDEEQKKLYREVIHPSICGKMMGLSHKEWHRCKLNDHIINSAAQAHIDAGQYNFLVAAGFDAYVRSAQMK